MLTRRGLLLGILGSGVTAKASAAFAIFQTYAPLGPIVTSANGRSFVKKGSPWLMVCDSAQSIVNIYGSDITTYLSTRASQGFTAIQIDLVATAYVNATTPYAAQTSSGAVYAFTNNGAITSSYVTNSAYWTLMDSYVAAINSYGMTAVLNPYEGSMNIGGGGNDLVAAGNTACYNFGQFVGARYKNNDVMWQLGNDLQVTSAAIFQAFQNLANGIIAGDPNHLITIELLDTPNPGGNDGFSTSFDNEGGHGSYASTFGSLGVNGSYTYGPTYGYTQVAYNNSGTPFGGVAGTNNASPVPVILLEANYVGENINGDGTTPITYRKQPWWLLLSGGLGGYIFGTHWTWDFSSGWASELTQGISDLQVWQTFVQSIAWTTLKPDQGRALATTGSAGWNTPSLTGTGTSYQNDNYVCMAADNLAGSATLAVVYFTQGTSSSITVDLSKFASTITAQWVDPTTGAKTTVSGSPFANTGTHAFTPTGNNTAGDPDWALLLTA
jgi:Protein of unknown function (DUF4038)/Putative collagen-binding domain of a collagenase